MHYSCLWINRVHITSDIPLDFPTNPHPKVEWVFTECEGHNSRLKLTGRGRDEWWLQQRLSEGADQQNERLPTCTYMNRTHRYNIICSYIQLTQQTCWHGDKTEKGQSKQYSQQWRQMHHGWAVILWCSVSKGSSCVWQLQHDIINYTYNPCNIIVLFCFSSILFFPLVGISVMMLNQSFSPTLHMLGIQ